MRRYQVPKPPPCKRPSFPRDSSDILFTTSLSQYSNAGYKRNHPYSSNTFSQTCHLSNNSLTTPGSSTNNSNQVAPSRVIHISQYPNIACLLDPNVELPNLNSQEIENIICGRHSGESSTTPVHKATAHASGNCLSATTAATAVVGTSGLSSATSILSSDGVTSMELGGSCDNTMDMIQEEELMDHATLLVMSSDQTSSPPLSSGLSYVETTCNPSSVAPFTSQQSTTSGGTFHTTSEEEETQNHLKRSCSLPANAVVPSTPQQMQQHSIDTCSLSSYASSPPGGGGSLEVQFVDSTPSGCRLYAMPQSTTGRVLMPGSNLNAQDYLGLETLTSHHLASQATPPSSSHRAVGALLLHTAPQHYQLHHNTTNTGPGTGGGPHPGLQHHHHSAVMPPVRVIVGPPNCASNTSAQLPPSSSASVAAQRRPRGINPLHTRRPRSEADHREDLLSLFPSCLSANELEMEESPVVSNQMEYDEDWEDDSLSEAASFSGSCDGMRSRTSVKSFTAGCYSGGSSSSAHPGNGGGGPVLFFSSASSSVHCHQRTTSTSNSMPPVSNNNNSNLYRCARRNCNASFATRAERDLHLREVHPTTAHKCLVCKKTFPSESKLQSHSISHLPFSERNILMCPFSNCGKRYFNMERYERHVANYHEADQLQQQEQFHRGANSDCGESGVGTAGIALPMPPGYPALSSASTHRLMNTSGVGSGVMSGTSGGYFDVRQMSCEHLACTPVGSHSDSHNPYAVQPRGDLYDPHMLPSLASGRSNLSCHVIGLSNTDSAGMQSTGHNAPHNGPGAVAGGVFLGGSASVYHNTSSSVTRRLSQPVSLNLCGQRGGTSAGAHSTLSVPAAATAAAATAASQNATAGTGGAAGCLPIHLEPSQSLDPNNSTDPTVYLNPSPNTGSVTVTTSSTCGSASSLGLLCASSIANTPTAASPASASGGGGGSTNGNPICCRLCGIGPLSSAEELQRHLLSHGREESTGMFACPVEGCNLHFQRRLELSMHLNIHFPFVQQLFVYCCPIEGCDTVCADMKTFRSHFAKHVTAEIPGDINSVIPLDLPTPQSEENAVAMLGDLPSMDNDMELIRESSSLFQALDLMKDFPGAGTGYENMENPAYPNVGTNDGAATLGMGPASDLTSALTLPILGNPTTLHQVPTSISLGSGGHGAGTYSPSVAPLSSPGPALTTARQRPKSTIVNDAALLALTPCPGGGISSVGNVGTMPMPAIYQRYSCGQLPVVSMSGVAGSGTTTSFLSQPHTLTSQPSQLAFTTNKRKLTELRPKESLHVRGASIESNSAMTACPLSIRGEPPSSYGVRDDLTL